MLNSKELIVSKLSKILPTYYEDYTQGNISLPCITYMENDNYSREEGTTIRYSDVAYCIKVWDNDISTAMGYAQAVDLAMRSLGFKRTSSTELVANAQICKIMYFRALAIEFLDKQ